MFKLMNVPNIDSQEIKFKTSIPKWMPEDL